MSPDPVSDEELAAADDVNAEKEVARNRPLTRPRPGHADLVGMQKYAFDDARPVLERASARETAARVALGEVAARFLEQAYGIRLVSHTVAIGSAAVRDDAPLPTADDVEALDADPVRAFDPEGSAAMVAEVDAAHKDGDTLGGVVEVVVTGLPPGLGSHVHWDRRLDARLAAGAHGHPGDQGRRGRRRLPHRRPPRVASPTTRWSAAPTASSAAAPAGPEAPRAACRSAGCCACARR